MRCLIAALILVPVIALAAPSPAPVSLMFKDTPLMAFAEATFKAVMQRDFVVSPDVIGSDRRITINVKNIDAANLPRFVEDLLLREGIVTTLRGGIYYLSLARQGAADGLQGPSAGKTESASLGPFSQPVAASGVAEGFTGAPSAEPIAADHAAVIRKDDDESMIFTPQNRDADFMLAVANAAFGPRSAVRAGPHLVLTGSKSMLGKLRQLLDASDTAPKGLRSC